MREGIAHTTPGGVTGNQVRRAPVAGWRAWFFRERIVRTTTWKARALIALTVLLLLAGPVRAGLPALAAALVEEEPPRPADLILIEVSEHPSFAAIQHAAALYRNGMAPRIAMTRYRDSARLHAAGVVLPPAFDRVVAVYAEAAGLDPERLERVPVDVVDPVTLNVARQVAEYCEQGGVRRLMVVGAPFHSRRSALSYRRFLSPRGIDVSMSPAWSGLTPANWWTTKDGIVNVGQESIKLLVYALGR
jgi:uncharacterized SAM-binding protein YcdF (DUF218 family)